MSITFTVRRAPVSVNATYIRAGFGAQRGAGGGKGLILSPGARSYKLQCHYAALAARQKGCWPSIADVRAVELTITTFNTKHDADAPVKLTQDALEGVFYVRDRVVQRVTCAKAKDHDGARVEITITLLERTDHAQGH